MDIDRQQKQGIETFYENLTGLDTVEPEEQRLKNEEYFEQIKDE